MKHIFSAAVAAMLLASPALAQQQLFQNFGTLDNPSPIDAQAIENFGTILTRSGSLLFDTESTRSFTNEFTGIMQGFPGFQFDLVQGYYRSPSSNFVNSGSISATLNLKVYSANIENSGLLSADTGGRVLLQGKNINLTRGSVRAGEGSVGNLGGYFQGFNNNFGTNYVNPTTVREEYWGTGNGGQMDLFFLSFGGFSWFDPVVTRNNQPGSSFLNVRPETTGPLFPGYSFFVVTNYTRVDANTINGVVQMVFVQTNLSNSAETKVFFHNPTFSAASTFTRSATVQFGIPDVDNITRRPFTRYYRFTDDSATATNYVLFQNSVRPGLFRPANFNLVRSETSFSSPTPAIPFDPNYIFTTDFGLANNHFSTRFPTHQYAAWEFTLNPTSFGGGGFGSDNGAAALSDFTNAPGRVEIVADQLNLRQAKIRADNLISIQATNLVDTFGVDIDALHINLELLSPVGTVVLSNMFPSQVQRLNGTVSAWSATWAVDQFVTNSLSFLNSSNVIHYQYHMLVVDNHLQTNNAAALENFCIKAPFVFLADDFTIKKCFQLLATCLVIETNGAIILSGTNINSTAFNLPNLLCLTNRGTFSVPQLANFGFDRAFPYQYIVNEGLFRAGSLLFRSDHFINTNRLIATDGPIFIEAKTNRLYGGFLSASTDVRFSGDELFATNSSIFSDGAISLSLSTRVSDLGKTNSWFAGQGLRLLKKPTKGDLLYTKVTSAAVAGATVFHDWAAEDRGNSGIGFLNNAALGRLVLDGATNSTFVFSGTDFTGGTNGMYIRFLELQNNATNFASAIQIDPNVTVYFTDSNLPPDKLTNVFGGRLVWVTTYSGPGPIGIPVALANGKTTQISAASLPAGLLSSTNNTGIQTGFTISRVTVVNLPPLTTVISWPGEANTSYTVEYTTNLASPNWQTLLSTFAPADGTVTVGDQAGSPGQRFYRVRYSR